MKDLSRALAALLDPRRIRLMGRAPVPAHLAGRRCRVVSDGPVDVAVVGARPSPRLLTRHPPRVAIALSTVAKADLGHSGPPLLGPEGGLWTPSLQVGIVAPGFEVRCRRPCLVLAQSCAMARHVVYAAARRGLRLLGALSVGDEGPVSWASWARAASPLQPAPLLLIALHRPTEVTDLLGLAAAGSPAVLMLTGSADRLAGTLMPDLPPLRAWSLTRGLGLPMVRTPEELVEAAFLLDEGFAPRSGRVLAAAPSEEQAALLEDLLHDRGLRAIPGARRSTTGVGSVVVDEHGSHGRRSAPSARGADCVLVAPRDPGAITLVLSEGRGKKRVLEGDQHTLGALSALLDVPPQLGPRPVRRSPSSGGRARQLLGGWRAELSESQVKALLACYGLSSPPEQLVTSASAASRAAQAIGYPVAVKAVGPTLRCRRPQGAVLLPVHNAAAVRQAFHDVLHSCGRMNPTPALDGVLVSRVALLPFALDCALLWPPEQRAVLVVMDPRRSHTLAAACPLDGPRARWLAERVLEGGRKPQPGHAPAARAVAALARFLAQLAALGADLQGRMRWLRLDTVSPPTSSSPPLVVDAYGLQTDSLLEPWA